MDVDVGVVGLGYVGLPTMLRASEASLSTVGFDIDESKVQRLIDGFSPISGVSEESVKRAIWRGAQLSSDPRLLRRCRAVLICVPTPLRDDSPDLDAIRSAATTVGSQLTDGQLVVLESTTYPGTTEEVLLPILEQESGLTAGVDFHLAYSPERIDPANSDYHIENTPRIVAGFGEEALQRAVELYSQLCSAVVPAESIREAEMAKLLENTYRQVNIALVNELAMLSRYVGVDIYRVIELAATKPFGFEAFHPGPGVGGHCIPIDPQYLADRFRREGQEFRFVELARSINETMPSYVVQRLLEILNSEGRSVAGRRVLLAGVAYKPGVSDTRESPAEGIVRRLRELGAAVGFTDSMVSRFEVDGEEVASVDPAQVAEYDCLVVVTNHSGMDLVSLAERVPVVLDTRGVLPTSMAHRL